MNVLSKPIKPINPIKERFVRHSNFSNYKPSIIEDIDIKMNGNSIEFVCKHNKKKSLTSKEEKDIVEEISRTLNFSE